MVLLIIRRSQKCTLFDVYCNYHKFTFRMISTQSVPCVYHIFGCVGYARHVAK